VSWAATGIVVALITVTTGLVCWRLLSLKAAMHRGFDGMQATMNRGFDRLRDSLHDGR